MRVLYYENIKRTNWYQFSAISHGNRRSVCGEQPCPPMKLNLLCPSFELPKLPGVTYPVD